MRADIQHEVSHDAKNFHFYHVFHVFQHIRRWPPTSAGKTRCLPVTLLNHPFWTGRIMGRSCFDPRFSGAQLCCPTVACPMKSPVQMARSSWLRCIQQGFILEGISYPFIFMQEKGVCHCIPFTVYRIYICIYIYRYFIYIPIPTYVLCTSLYPTILYILTDWNLECAPGFQKSLFRKLRMRRSPGRRPDS